MNEQDILEELKFQADLHDDHDDSEYSVFFIRCIGEIRGLREQLAAKDTVIAKMRQELFCAGVEPDVANDDSALQEALKQAKREGQREALLNAANIFSDRNVMVLEPFKIFTAEDIRLAHVNEIKRCEAMLRKLAKEIK